MTDRRRRMGRLFACLVERGISDDERHAWASEELRPRRDVDSFTTLTIAEIDQLIAVAEYGDGDYVMCGEVGPDDLPCVLHEGHGHNGDGEYECTDEYGRLWVLR